MQAAPREEEGSKESVQEPVDVSGEEELPSASAPTEEHSSLVAAVESSEPPSAVEEQPESPQEPWYKRVTKWMRVTPREEEVSKEAVQEPVDISDDKSLSSSEEQPELPQEPWYKRVTKWMQAAPREGTSKEEVREPVDISGDEELSPSTVPAEESSPLVAAEEPIEPLPAAEEQPESPQEPRYKLVTQWMEAAPREEEGSKESVQEPIDMSGEEELPSVSAPAEEEPSSLLAAVESSEPPPAVEEQSESPQEPWYKRVTKWMRVTPREEEVSKEAVQEPVDISDDENLSSSEEPSEASQEPWYKRATRWMKVAPRDDETPKEMPQESATLSEDGAPLPALEPVKPKPAKNVVPPPELLDETQENEIIETSSDSPVYEKLMSWLQSAKEPFSSETPEEPSGDDEETSPSDATGVLIAETGTPWYENLIAMFQGTPEEVREGTQDAVPDHNSAQPQSDENTTSIAARLADVDRPDEAWEEIEEEDDDDL